MRTPNHGPWLVLAAWVLAAGCSSTSHTSSTSSCAPGEVELCDHASGCTARKVCQADKQFGACECSDGGSGASGGAGAVAGQSGSGGVGGGGALGGSGGVAAAGAGGVAGMGGVAASAGSGGGGAADAGACPTVASACAGTCGPLNHPCGQTYQCGGCSDPTQTCENNACVCGCASIVNGAPICEGGGCACAGHNGNSDPNACGCASVTCPGGWVCQGGVCYP